MNSFDDQLKKALERKEPSSDFTSRVLLAASRSSMPHLGAPRRWWNPVWAAPLAAALALTAGLAYEQYHARMEGERAKEKLVVALKVTSLKLQETQALVEGISKKRGSYE